MSEIQLYDDAASQGRACDAHIHIFDERFANGLPVFPGSTVQDYLSVRRAYATSRVVVVQPRAFGVDNTCTLKALDAFGSEQARGIVVVMPEISDQTLREMNQRGVRGIRFSLSAPGHPSQFVPAQAAVSLDSLEALAQRIAPLGWHIQLHWTADQITQHQALLERLPVTLVFDHMARIAPEAGTAHPAFGIVMRLTERGKAWVKLAAPYLDSKVGRAGNYADMQDIARAWVQAAPERLVWGSDWPHPSAAHELPDEDALYGLLARWAPNPATRHQILVTNPELLYGFPASIG